MKSPFKNPFFIAACGLALTTMISFSGMCYFEMESFENHRAYEAAMAALEAQQRTVTGRVDMAYVCRRK